MAPRFDRDQIVAALSPRAVLDRFGIEGRATGRELRTGVCPTCGPRSRRDAVAINLGTGMWDCKVTGCSGDVFALVAGLAGLDARRDFPKVLELAADIAGVSIATDPEAAQRIADRRRVEAARMQADQEARAAARATMPAKWAALATRHADGEAYLAGRGIDAAALRRHGDVVRYSLTGEPAVALRDLATGAITGVQYRCLAGDRKLRCEPGSQLAGAALHGRVGEIALGGEGGVDVAVLVEGLADTLVAVLTWPGCAIFGAPAGELERVATAVAPRIAACRGWLLVSVDNDRTGVDKATDAVVAAVHHGLVLAPLGAGLNGRGEVRLVRLGEHHDLADAHRAGWRWSWPSAAAGAIA